MLQQNEDSSEEDGDIINKLDDLEGFTRCDHFGGWYWKTIGYNSEDDNEESG